MTRRHVYAGIAASVIPITLFAGALVADDAAGTQRSAVEQTKPNIIVIMVDDANVDDLAAMPNTRHLLGAQDGNGATYKIFNTATPLCCPSRATLLTGQYSHNNGVWDNDKDNHGGWEAFKPIEDQALPVAMRQAGYWTTFLGKYLNGYNEPTVPPGWSRWAGLFGRTTYNYNHFDVSVDGVPESVDGYNTWNLGSRAAAQIEDRVVTPRPFFMWLSFVAPHTTGGQGNRHVPAEPTYEGDSRVGLPTDDPSFNEKVIRDKPPWVAELPRLSDEKIAEATKIRQERRDALRSVDDQVQRIVAEVRAAGEMQNTIFMFTSDNGYLFGEHRITMNKRFPYTPSTHVPLLVRGPGFTPGVHDEPVSNIDLAPTIMGLAGATPLRPVDGMDIRHFVPQGRQLLIEHLNPYPTFSMPAYQGVRQGGDMYVEYDNGVKELYVDDPYQQRNVAGLPEYAARQAEMAALLEGQPYRM